MLPWICVRLKGNKLKYMGEAFAGDCFLIDDGTGNGYINLHVSARMGLSFAQLFRTIMQLLPFGLEGGRWNMGNLFSTGDLSLSIITLPE